MKEYTSPYDLLAEECPDVLMVLTEDERICLQCVLDFESIVLREHDGVVDTVDTIDGEIYSTEPFAQFVRETVHFAIDDCRGEV